MKKWYIEFDAYQINMRQMYSWQAQLREH